MKPSMILFRAFFLLGESRFLEFPPEKVLEHGPLIEKFNVMVALVHQTRRQLFYTKRLCTRLAQGVAKGLCIKKQTIILSIML